MSDRFIVACAVVLLVAIPVIPAIVLNLRDDGWQFSFRTAMASMTLLAVLLALLGYAVKNAGW